MRITAGLMSLPALVLSGCLSLTPGSPETRFYTLESGDSALSGIAPRDNRFSLGMGPVLLPDLLNRPQIVTQDDSHRLQLGEFDHWAGNLEEAVERFMARRLMQAFPNAMIYSHPWSQEEQPGYQVRVDVLRLIGEPGGTTHLEGTWSLVNRTRREEEVRARFVLQDQADGRGFDALIASYARLLDQLALQIAENLSKISHQAARTSPEN